MMGQSNTTLLISTMVMLNTATSSEVTATKKWHNRAEQIWSPGTNCHVVGQAMLLNVKQNRCSK